MAQQKYKSLYAYAGWNPATKAYNPDNNADGYLMGLRLFPG
jgi:hypothetical protein